MDRPQEDIIVEHILDAIADQRLRAGTKLAEQALSDFFSCNRAHVRRALATLAAHRVVEHKPNRGAFVATPTPEEARDVFQARRAIETTIGRNAVRNATPADIDRLRTHLAEEQTARQGGNRPRAIRLSRGFHLLLAQIGRNAVLAHYLDELTMRTSLIIGLYGSGGTLCADDEHARIVDAIAEGNETEALELLDRHLRHIEQGIEFRETRPQTDILSSILAAGG
ncbi:transcriptional regulator, GntR family [Cribrihabitans marinus]|uniref:Transcriptional regulator, GntR family n=1 Tax=Cribrihabitans marinus TaxID=1227549 RepID=A0A1H6TJQ5_9RHOB|nr:GntR family transcriptional regulator [Cribrihabitans marinus]GGH21770.1 GntR family transcriptional regulator [Cribrihabitans marinus]SEI79536.1 transcriptional regulator, GntR family [Cribrihabitans marinus]